MKVLMRAGYEICQLSDGTPSLCRVCPSLDPLSIVLQSGFSACYSGSAIPVNYHNSPIAYPLSQRSAPCWVLKQWKFRLQLGIDREIALSATAKCNSAFAVVKIKVLPITPENYINVRPLFLRTLPEQCRQGILRHFQDLSEKEGNTRFLLTRSCHSF